MPFCFEVLPLIMGSAEDSGFSTNRALDNFFLNLFIFFLLAFFMLDFWLLYFLFFLVFYIIQKFKCAELLCF